MEKLNSDFQLKLGTLSSELNFYKNKYEEIKLDMDKGSKDLLESKDREWKIQKELNA